MDSFARLAMIQGLVPPFRATLPRVEGDTRRYAAYFPSQESLCAESSETDAFSTWAYSAPSPCSGSSSSTSFETEAADTPAKQIANHYRALHLLDDISNMTTRSSYPSKYSDETGTDYWETSSLDEPSVPSTDNLRAVYRQSRHEALLATFQEAMDVAERCGVGAHNRVVCQRSGCRDMLLNPKALSYHLHIHDIHDRTINAIDCPRCKCRFEDQTAQHLHRCTKPHGFSIPSFPAGALRRLQKILSVIHRSF